MRCCGVVELRQYTLQPKKRDILIDLFDEHLVESQEAVGMTVIGQFRDRSHADRFVWLRGFPDMEARHEALEAFYGGPVWAEHAAAANDTMLAWNDVLLLKPVRPETAFDFVYDRPVAAALPTTVLAGIYASDRPIDAELVDRFEREVAPVLESNDVRIEGIFVTEPAPNRFARLPVREGENVLAWFGTVEDRAQPPGWLEGLDLAIPGASPSFLTLDPTPRSALGGGPRAARVRSVRRS